MSASGPLAGQGLRMGSGESAKRPTDIKEPGSSWVLLSSGNVVRSADLLPCTTVKSGMNGHVPASPAAVGAPRTGLL